MEDKRRVDGSGIMTDVLSHFFNDPMTQWRNSFCVASLSDFQLKIDMRKSVTWPSSLSARGKKIQSQWPGESR
jgi:hypothetical protein